MTRWWWVLAPALLLPTAGCGGGSTDAAQGSPEALQRKMAIVQDQFQAEQQVLARNDDSLLNIVSGGGPGSVAATLLEMLHDPTILLGDVGDAVEARSPESLAEGWALHADAWCALGSDDFDDEFFLVYGGPHTLSALVAFLDAYCGREHAVDLVLAGDAQGLGEGMATSGDPTAGIDLDALLDRLDGSG